MQAALETIRAAGHEVIAAVVAGGREKLPVDGVTAYGETRAITGPDARHLLDRALVELRPECVLDLADEPVLDYRRRLELASIALARSTPYEGPDFRFEPPERPRVATRPSVGVLGTGKRSGKTAVGGQLARLAAELGRRPVVVAMGRGGPPVPEVLHGEGRPLEAADLLELADRGRHAASDYVEDALLANVPTVGCFRCGGGLAGGVTISNVPAGVLRACELDPGVVVVEGSGSAVPPVHVDAAVLVVPARVPEEYLSGYFGPFRLLISDVVVVTMCEDPFGTPSSISSITSQIRNAFRLERPGEGSSGELQVVRTVFRPRPTRPIDDRKVFVVTTAPPAAGETIRSHLEEQHRCTVVGRTHLLADRQALTKELDAMPRGTDTLLCEVKAAAVDVATRHALERGLDVVYMDNQLVGVDGDDPAVALRALLDLGESRFGGAG